MVLLIVLMLFTIVVDYMLLSALSAILLPALELDTKEFGMIVSAYGLSAAVSSFLSVGFADRFDRKRYLLFFYFGFLAGIICCALAPSFETLFAARIIAGLFGGVVGSTCLTIVADLFKPGQRGRIMGFVQMSYAAGQVGGLPLAMYAAITFTWQAPYWAITVLGLLLGFSLFFYMQPLRQHLQKMKPEMPWRKMLHVVDNKDHWNVFLNNSFLVGGDALILTFDAAYMANNLSLSMEKVPLIYLVTGGVSLLFGPLLGRLSDKIGKLRVFTFGTILSVFSVALYANLEEASFLLIIIMHALLFIGINARMISSTSLGMAVPKVHERGAFMAFDTSIQQLAGSLAAILAGFVIYTADDGSLDRYPLLSILVILLMVSSIFLMSRIDKFVLSDQKAQQKS